MDWTPASRTVGTMAPGRIRARMGRPELEPDIRASFRTTTSGGSLVREQLRVRVIRAFRTRVLCTRERCKRARCTMERDRTVPDRMGHGTTAACIRAHTTPGDARTHLALHAHKPAHERNRLCIQVHVRIRMLPIWPLPAPEPPMTILTTRRFYYPAPTSVYLVFRFSNIAPANCESHQTPPIQHLFFGNKKSIRIYFNFF